MHHDKKTTLVHQDILSRRTLIEPETSVVTKAKSSPDKVKTIASKKVDSKKEDPKQD